MELLIQQIPIYGVHGVKEWLHGVGLGLVVIGLIALVVEMQKVRRE